MLRCLLAGVVTVAVGIAAAKAAPVSTLAALQRSASCRCCMAILASTMLANLQANLRANLQANLRAHRPCCPAEAT
jgi:hypothetical protein